MGSGDTARCVGVRYCGGCNPRYDRVTFVQRLEKLLPEYRFEPFQPGERYDAALVVCGCKNMCANTSDITVPPAQIFTVNAFDNLLPVRDKLKRLAREEEQISMSREELLAVLPHREPMLLLDRVVRMVPGESIVAEYTAAAENPVFSGHFPDQPVFPGSLQIEAMAQAADVMLLSTDRHRGKTPLLRGLGRANFHTPVLPGKCLEIHAALLGERPEMGATVCRGQIFVDGTLASDAEIILSMREKQS